MTIQNQIPVLEGGETTEDRHYIRQVVSTLTNGHEHPWGPR